MSDKVTKYLTRRPKTDAGRELRALALTLTKTSEKGVTLKMLIAKKTGKIDLDPTVRKYFDALVACLEQDKAHLFPEA